MRSGIHFQGYTPKLSAYVEVSKDGVNSHIRFCRGELTADAELYEIYLKTDWKRN